MPPPENLQFEASAYLQTLIGRGLFRSREFALIELVKNAYDSGASFVEVSIQLPSAKTPGTISVRDDGEGMDLEQFKRSFMFAGFSRRPDQVEAATRVPTGEKGIGRFASDRLGSQLIVVSWR